MGGANIKPKKSGFSALGAQELFLLAPNCSPREENRRCLAPRHVCSHCGQDSRQLLLGFLYTQWVVGCYLLNWNHGEGVSSSSKGAGQTELRTQPVNWLPESTIEEELVICNFFFLLIPGGGRGEG